MATMAICIVKGMMLQKPSPKALLTASGSPPCRTAPSATTAHATTTKT
ncbi:Uncharacterised protein [Bordetella pertussis]|nr:Uncharacterised protein [Bordetella pertussis]CFW31929.1 Uncharacterised protein [Bordetella pertussis]